VDRQDTSLGSEPGGVCLASSLPFDATYFVANEELLVSRPTISGPYSPGLRADMVLQSQDGGGAVFCTGSIAWVGGLAAHGGDPAVQRIMHNVLRRFLDPAPLAVEQSDAD
jgi:N,N-dimethylformamidase